VQPVSVDEAYLEYPAGTDGRQAAAELRSKIMDATQCPASVGIGYNMITARLATKKVLMTPRVI
jgi:nucleotidyltransferase/DNA polymerase involved in DNA repair